MAEAKRAGSRSVWIPILVAGTLLMLPVGGAAADGEMVDLELVLATDVSYSVDDNEAQLQRQGIADAFRSDAIIKAIEAGVLGRIAVAYLDFAEANTTHVLVGWRIIHDKETALAFASELMKVPRTHGLMTSISEGIELATRLIEASPFAATEMTIDVSGDGPNNEGPLVVPVRDAALAKGITINGLPIVTEADKFDPYYIPDLDDFYRGCVIGGPRAFMQVAHGFEDFTRAVRRKLVLEISNANQPREPSGDPLVVRVAAAGQAATHGYVYPRGCDIGERMRYGSRFR
jgi:hypothetical protein